MPLTGINVIRMTRYRTIPSRFYFSSVTMPIREGIWTRCDHAMETAINLPKNYRTIWPIQIIVISAK